MRFARPLSVLLLFFGLAGSLFAQSATSALQGTVTDPKGAVVPNANVTISNPAKGFTQSTRSDSTGGFRFTLLPPASYTLTINASGFAEYRREVRLLVNTPATVNAELRVGASTVVEVTGEVATINTQDASIGNVFTQSQLELLPSEGRDPVSILSLQPGVVYLGNTDQTTDSRTGSVAGARSDQTNVTIDGIDDNEQLQGNAFQGVLRPTLDSIQEFRVTTANSNAEAGRSSGAQVVLVTKGGTNRFHGSLYEYHRPTITTANDWFNKQAQAKAGLPNDAPKYIRNTFGGTFGGPIKKDRVFFFVAYEGQRKAETQQVTRVVPSQDLRNGTIHYLDAGGNVVTLNAAQIASMDPNCTGNSTCPLGAGPDPAVMAVFNTYPLPNTDIVGDTLNFRGFTFPGSKPANLNTAVARLDFNLTSNQRVFVRGNYQDDRTSLPPQFPGQPPNTDLRAANRGIAVGYTAAISPSLVNNFRYGFIRESAGQVGVGKTHFSQFRGLDDPVGTTRTVVFNVPVNNFVDDLNWTKGKHTFQFGGNLRLIHNNRASDAQNYFSSLTNVSWLDNASIANSGSSLDPAAFGFTPVGDAFSTDYDLAIAALSGILPQVNAVYNQNKTGAVVPEGSMIGREFRSWESELYAQDSWRIRPNLTITAGLRYTLLQPPYEGNGVQVAPTISMNEWFRQRAAAMAQGNTFHAPVTLNLSGQANGGKPYWDWDYKDVAPRFAIAWSPGWTNGFLRQLTGGPEKTSIRAGYGIYYDHFGEGVVNTFDRQGSFGLTTALVNPAGFQDVDCAPRFTAFTDVPTGTFCGQNVTPPTPGPFPVTPPQGFADGSFAIYWGLDDKLKTPYSQVFSLSVERELPHGFVIESDYVGRLGRHLLQEIDLAMPLDITDPASKMDYFTAATMLAKAAEAGTDINAMAPIPYFEHLFPGAAGGPLGSLSCAPGAHVGPFTATQNMYDMYSCFLHNETTALFIADLLCFPACMSVNGVQTPFQFFDDQFSSLYSWSSIGNSSYHSWQLMLRKRTGWAQFDVNYTFSKSIDEGSNAERISLFEGFGLGSQIINSWSPHQLRAPSDFDTRHQINSNWLVELPWGKKRHYQMTGVTDAFLGDWDFSGLARWTSGFPFSVGPGLGNWPTNWELTGNAFLVGNPGSTGSHVLPGGSPNVFGNPTQALNAFRFAHPGESGQRNNLRGPGYWGLDLGIGKTWELTESQKLSFRWETFNVTNSVRFDVATVGASLTDSQSFGKFNRTLTNPRVMQFALRYTF